MATAVAPAPARVSSFQKSLAFGKDLRFGGGDLLAQLEPEPEPEPAGPSVRQPSKASAWPLGVGADGDAKGGPVPYTAFLRTGFQRDRTFALPEHELAASLCEAAQGRALGLGKELRTPGAAVAAAREQAGEHGDARALLQGSGGDALLQLEAVGEFGGASSASPARGARLRALVELCRAERQSAEVHVVVGGGNPPRGLMIGEGAASTEGRRPGLLATPQVLYTGFDPSVGPPAGLRQGMALTMVGGRSVSGWTAAALEVVIELAETDSVNNPVRLTFSRASPWAPAWQDLRAGAAIMLQARERCRAAVKGPDGIKSTLAAMGIQKVFRGRVSRLETAVLEDQRRRRWLERRQIQLEFATIRVQSMHRGRNSRREIVSYHRTRSALVTLQRQQRYKMYRRAQETAASTRLEALVRSFVVRRSFGVQRQAAVAIQSARRALRARRSFATHKAAACRVQSHARGRQTRQNIARWNAATMYIQRCQRGHIGRLVVKWMRWRLKMLGAAATTCQANVRGASKRRWFRKLKCGALVLSALYRGRLVRIDRAEKHAAATVIQNALRMKMAVRLWETQKRSVRDMQRFARGWSTRKALAWELEQIKLAKILWAEMDARDVKEMVVEPTMRNLEKMIEFNNKFEGQLLALRKAAALNPDSLTSPRARESSRGNVSPKKKTGAGQTMDTLSGLMGGKQMTNILTPLVNSKAAEEHLTGGYTFHPQTSYTRELLKHGKRGHEAPFHRRRAEGVVRQVLEMRSGDLVSDKDIDAAARTVLTLPEDLPRLRSIGRLKGHKKLMVAVNAMQSRDFVLRNCDSLNASQEEEFEVTFSQLGALGVKFAPNKDTANIEVVGVRPGTQAEGYPELQAGLILLAVGGVDVAGAPLREVISMLKGGGRPLTLTFCEPAPITQTDEVSFTMRIRLYEGGAIPSPPRPPGARAPLTPHKLTQRSSSASPPATDVTTADPAVLRYRLRADLTADPTALGGSVNPTAMEDPTALRSRMLDDPTAKPGTVLSKDVDPTALRLRVLDDPTAMGDAPAAQSGRLLQGKEVDPTAFRSRLLDDPTALMDPTSTMVAWVADAPPPRAVVNLPSSRAVEAEADRQKWLEARRQDVEKKAASPKKPSRLVKPNPEEFWAKMQRADAAREAKLAARKESLRKAEEAELTFQPKLGGPYVAQRSSGRQVQAVVFTREGLATSPTSAAVVALTGALENEATAVQRRPAGAAAAATGRQQLSRHPPPQAATRLTRGHPDRKKKDDPPFFRAPSSQEILDARRRVKPAAVQRRPQQQPQGKPQVAECRRQQGSGKPQEPRNRKPQRPREPLPRSDAMKRVAGVDAMAKIAAANHARRTRAPSPPPLNPA